VISRGPSVALLAEFVNGTAFKPEDFSESGEPVVRIKQLLDESANLELAAVPPRPVWLQDGDLVFSWSATLAVRFWNRGRALLNQHLFRVDVHPEIERRWFAYVLEEGVRRLEPLMHGSAMTHITKEMLRSLSIAVPSLIVQRDVADYLDREMAWIDALVAAKLRMVDLLEERRKSFIEHLIWGHAKEVRTATILRRVASRIDVGIAEAATHAYASGGVPLLRSMNIRENAIDATDLLFIAPWFAERNKSKYVYENDILTVRTGTVGVSALVPLRFNRSQCFTQLITTISPTHSAEFVSLALNSQRAREYFQLTGWGSAQSNISVPILGSAPIPMVDLATQLREVDLARGINDKYGKVGKALTVQLKLLSEYRQALITKAITGHLDIPEEP
jgi:type I restriction enzyme, S subunit